MASIAVIHRLLGVGGGESVCFHILDALNHEHELHLYSINNPDLDTLNKAFGTTVHPKQITAHSLSLAGLKRSDILSAVECATGGQIGSQGALQLALMKSAYQEEWKDYDLRLTSHGELALSAPTIQYIQYPFLNRWRTERQFEINSRVGRLLNMAIIKFIGGTPTRINETILVTNSQWSADQLRQIYNTSPEIVYPPVQTDQFDDLPWNERENGFVTVGRIAPDKRTLEACRIIDKVRGENTTYIYISWEQKAATIRTLVDFKILRTNTNG